MMRLFVLKENLYSNEDLLNELRITANKLGTTSSIREYARLSKINCVTIIKRFGSWVEAIRLAGLELKNTYLKRNTTS